MKITTTLAVAFACATLAACGGGETEAENMDANLMMTENLGTTDLNMDMNATDMNMMNGTDMNMDMNATGTNTTDMNTTTNTL